MPSIWQGGPAAHTSSPGKLAVAGSEKYMYASFRGTSGRLVEPEPEPEPEPEAVPVPFNVFSLASSLALREPALVVVVADDWLDRPDDVSVNLPAIALIAVRALPISNANSASIINKRLLPSLLNMCSSPVY